MKTSDYIRATGTAIGLGLFIAAGLFLTSAMNKPAQDAPVPAVAVPESVTAPAERLGKAFAAVAARVKPAVVSVYSEKTVRVQSPEFQFPFGDDFFHQFFGDQFHFPHGNGQRREFNVPQKGMGSGMILDTKGHILTNYHVVKDVDEIRVNLPDRRTFEAKIVGEDSKTDVAILELQGSVPDKLPAVELGDSDALEDGNLVMAVGAPFGLTQTVTTGIISAKGRSDIGIADYEDFLQTDAPINPGNSGGPLVNMRGQVIGMNSAIESSMGQFAGVGFAIPVNMIKSILPTLLKGEHVSRGMLGVRIQDVTRDLARQFGLAESKGALVSQVGKDTPAEKAGLQAGDIIVRFDGKEVRDTSQMRNLVAATAPGTQTRIVVVRNGKEQTLAVTVGKLGNEAPGTANAQEKSDNTLTRLGLVVHTLTPDLAREFGIEAKAGVLITDVEDGSLASASGLKPGDLIVEADRQPVANAPELLRILARDREQILLLIKRSDESLFLVLRLK